MIIQHLSTFISIHWGLDIRTRSYKFFSDSKSHWYPTFEKSNKSLVTEAPRYPNRVGGEGLGIRTSSDRFYSKSRSLKGGGSRYPNNSDTDTECAVYV